MGIPVSNEFRKYVPELKKYVKLSLQIDAKTVDRQGDELEWDIKLLITFGVKQKGL